MMSGRDEWQLKQINNNRLVTGRKLMSEKEYFNRLAVAKETQEWTRECLGEGEMRP